MPEPKAPDFKGIAFLCVAVPVMVIGIAATLGTAVRVFLFCGGW